MTARIEEAIVLAGGLGERMRPLTDELPKSMLPLLGRPLLDYVLDTLRRAGVRWVVLACGYQAEAIQRHFGTEAGGLALEYVIESRPLGTGGALRLASDGLDRAFLAVNGDQLLDIDLRPLTRLHVDKAAQVTMLLKGVDDPRRYGVVELAADGRVLRFVEKPSTAERGALVNVGVYVLEPAALSAIRPREAASFEQDVLPLLVEEGSVFGVELPGYWLDVGTPESYERAERELGEKVAANGKRRSHRS
jgi:mannose-1-phosphate guanylyltransferase